ncbi:MAG: DUF4097 family beta strand repeat-containing protein [Ignavibacteria bacterium]|jgi:DUF4097 and DUF4098 domain-containing protein YvlB
MKISNLKKIFILFFFFSFSNIILADEFTLIEQTFESSNFKNVDIKTFNGNVTVKTWEKAAVNVLIRGNQEALKSVDYILDNKDGNISVTTSLKGETNKPGIELRIEIYVPKYFNAEIKTSGGEIKLGALTGNIKLESTGGDIYVSEISGESDLKSTGGSIKISTFKGNVTAITSGGNISLEGADGEIKAETSGGDIKIKYAGNNMGMTLKNTGGDIKVILPETFKAQLDATSTAGEIKTDFSVLVNKDYSGQTLKGIINGGGNIIKCTTTGGKISIIK